MNFSLPAFLQERVCNEFEFTPIKISHGPQIVSAINTIMTFDEVTGRVRCIIMFYFFQLKNDSVEERINTYKHIIDTFMPDFVSETTFRSMVLNDAYKDDTILIFSASMMGKANCTASTVNYADFQDYLKNKDGVIT